MELREDWTKVAIQGCFAVGRYYSKLNMLGLLIPRRGMIVRKQEMHGPSCNFFFPLLLLTNPPKNRATAWSSLFLKNPRRKHSLQTAPSKKSLYLLSLSFLFGWKVDLYLSSAFVWSWESSLETMSSIDNSLMVWKG